MVLLDLIADYEDIQGLGKDTKGLINGSNCVCVCGLCVCATLFVSNGVEGISELDLCFLSLRPRK
ncbi:hypothetical protein NPIL_268991, partial [Nephila pilipes]